MSAPAGERPAHIESDLGAAHVPASGDDVAAPLPHAGLAVAVLGARDCGAGELAAELRAHTAANITETLGAAGPEAPASTSSTEAIDVVLVAVDLICPIRPDDMEAIVALAGRFPVAVVLVRAERYTDIAGTVDTIAGQLREHDVADPLLWARLLDSHACATAAGLDAPEGADALLRAARDRARRGGRGTPGVIHGGFPAPQDGARQAREAQATLDWLQRARTESVTARSAVLRQQSHGARIGLQALVSRQLRELAADAKNTLASAGRGELERSIEAIDNASAETSRQLSERARAESSRLRRRHLGSDVDAPAETPAQLRLRFSRPPVHRGEEAIMLLMGAAGGAGLGRLVAVPFGGSWAAMALIIPLALAAGAALGSLGVRARRAAALRNHLIGATVEHFAALRSEIDLVVSEQLLHAEAAITDAFAYDSGHRVREIEKRISAFRHSIRGGSQETAGPRS